MSAARAVLILTCLPATATPQGAQVENAPVEAKTLIVKVVSSFVEGTVPAIGAGIIFGASGREFYVATAAHVVQRAAPAQRIWVVFAAGDSVPATVARAQLTPDLAVLRVSVVPSRIARLTPRSWDRLGNARRLRSDDPVSPVGCPNDGCWQAPTPPDRIVGIDRLGGIVFQSQVVEEGHSGGALFNGWWEVVGMVTDHVPARASAIPIDVVLALVRSWRFPVSLATATIPRSGYRASLGAVMLRPTSAAGATDTKSGVPSGRAMLEHQVLPIVSWHVAFLRLTPRNLAVTAAMGGVGLRLPKRGRFAFRPYAEIGFGQVEGRYDLGGYYIAAPSGGSKYVPLWNRVVGSGLGIGGGLNVDLVVLPRTILELSSGYWSFTTPINAPKPTNLFVGGGVRLGL